MSQDPFVNIWPLGIVQDTPGRLPLCFACPDCHSPVPNETKSSPLLHPSSLWCRSLPCKPNWRTYYHRSDDGAHALQSDSLVSGFLGACAATFRCKLRSLGEAPPLRRWSRNLDLPADSGTFPSFVLWVLHRSHPTEHRSHPTDQAESSEQSFRALPFSLQSLGEWRIDSMITPRIAICFGLRTTVSVRLIQHKQAPPGTHSSPAATVCTDSEVDNIWNKPKRNASSCAKTTSKPRFVSCCAMKVVALDITDSVHTWPQKFHPWTLWTHFALWLSHKQHWLVWPFLPHTSQPVEKRQSKWYKGQFDPRLCNNEHRLLLISRNALLFWPQRSQDTARNGRTWHRSLFLCSTVRTDLKGIFSARLSISPFQGWSFQSLVLVRLGHASSWFVLLHLSFSNASILLKCKASRRNILSSCASFCRLGKPPRQMNFAVRLDFVLRSTPPHKKIDMSLRCRSGLGYSWRARGRLPRHWC